MRQALATFRSIPRLLNIFLLCSIVSVLAIRFWLVDVPNPWGWTHAPDAADILNDFFLAYIASYLFFVVGDHIQEAKRKRLIAPSVHKRIGDILMASIELTRNLNYGLLRAGMGHKGIADITRLEWDQIHINLFWQPKDNGVYSVYCSLLESIDSYVHACKAPLDVLLDQYADHDTVLSTHLDRLRVAQEELKTTNARESYGELGTREEYMFKSSNNDACPYAVRFAQFQATYVIIAMIDLAAYVKKDPHIYAACAVLINSLESNMKPNRTASEFMSALESKRP